MKTRPMSLLVPLVIAILFLLPVPGFAANAAPTGGASAPQPVKDPGTNSTSASAPASVGNTLASTEPQSPLSEATLPASEIKAPSNSNYSFTVTTQADGTQSVTLTHSQTGEASLITTVPPPPAGTTLQIDGLDVSPDGTVALVNIKRNSYNNQDHQGEILLYSVAEKKIKQTWQGQVQPIWESASSYVFTNGHVLFNITQDIWDGHSFFHSEWGYIVAPDSTFVKSQHIMALEPFLGGVQMTPQKDKFVVGGYDGRWGVKYSIITYDLASKTLTYAILRNQQGATYAYGGIKAISADGKTAIVASEVNAIYVVPLGVNVDSCKTENVYMPPGASVDGYRIVSAAFDSTGTMATITTKNGNRYKLNLKLMTLTRCDLFPNQDRCPV